MLDDPIAPALTSLVRFTQGTSRSRVSIVREIQGYANQPFRPIFYQSWFAAFKNYVGEGNLGGAFERAIFAADARHAPSFQAAAEGAKRILAAVRPNAAQSGPKPSYFDTEELILKVRVHLALVCADGTVYWCYAHMGSWKLNERALYVIRHTLARVAASEPVLIAPIPAILHMRRGELELIDTAIAGDAEAAAFVRKEVREFNEIWFETAV